MKFTERRESKRIALHHPVLMAEVGHYTGHRGEILNASVKGIRVRTTKSYFCVGKELNITSLPQEGDIVNLQPFRCRVIWENAKDSEVGLECLE